MAIQDDAYNKFFGDTANITSNTQGTSHQKYTADLAAAEAAKAAQAKYDADLKKYNEDMAVYETESARIASQNAASLAAQVAPAAAAAPILTKDQALANYLAAAGNYKAVAEASKNAPRTAVYWRTPLSGAQQMAARNPSGQPISASASPFSISTTRSKTYKYDNPEDQLKLDTAYNASQSAKSVYDSILNGTYQSTTPPAAYTKGMPTQTELVQASQASAQAAMEAAASAAGKPAPPTPIYATPGVDTKQSMAKALRESGRGQYGSNTTTTYNYNGVESAVPLGSPYGTNETIYDPATKKYKTRKDNGEWTYLTGPETNTFLKPYVSESSIGSDALKSFLGR